LVYRREQGHVVVKLASISSSRIGLSLADDGPGVQAEDRDKLFDRFHRGRNAATPGAGLGLAIVKQAVERMGGRIVVRAGLQGSGLGFAAELGI
jgi:two-component system sensor histidine kinase QseC